MTSDKLAEAMRAVAEENWHALRQPMLLSELPRKLAERLNADYKLLLGSESLKGFIKSTGPSNGYRLVEHPIQRAKLGLVPSNVDFEFTVDSEGAGLLKDVSTRDIEGFVRVLRSLTPDELSRVLLPAHLVVKLLRSFKSRELTF
jgi:hypothetical protein